MDTLAERNGCGPWKLAKRFAGETARGDLAGEEVVLLKPQTYMNRSGESVAPLARYYRIPTAQVVVVHDDVDLQLGRLKLKQGGGDGGHNGLKSLTEALSSANYVRVRLGVGRPRYGEVSDYVLSPFASGERETVDELLERSSVALETLVQDGLRQAMNALNRRSVEKEKLDKS